VQKFDELKAAGVDEIWCVSVNDAFVMGAWARDLKTVRQGSHAGRRQCCFRAGHGPDAGPHRPGMGLRSNRYSMLVKDGKVATLNIEAPGKFEVSDAATLLAQAKG
jgi:peroxiredoxin